MILSVVVIIHKFHWTVLWGPLPQPQRAPIALPRSKGFTPRSPKVPRAPTRPPDPQRPTPGPPKAHRAPKRPPGSQRPSPGHQMSPRLSTGLQDPQRPSTGPQRSPRLPKGPPPFPPPFFNIFFVRWDTERPPPPAPPPLPKGPWHPKGLIFQSSFWISFIEMQELEYFSSVLLWFTLSQLHTLDFSKYILNFFRWNARVGIFQ
jgi:hypothetical protein